MRAAAAGVRSGFALRSALGLIPRARAVGLPRRSTPRLRAAARCSALRRWLTYANPNEGGRTVLRSTLVVLIGRDAGDVSGFGIVEG